MDITNVSADALITAWENGDIDQFTKLIKTEPPEALGMPQVRDLLARIARGERPPRGGRHKPKYTRELRDEWIVLMLARLNGYGLPIRNEAAESISPEYDNHHDACSALCNLLANTEMALSADRIHKIYQGVGNAKSLLTFKIEYRIGQMLKTEGATILEVV